MRVTGQVANARLPPDSPGRQVLTSMYRSVAALAQTVSISASARVRIGYFMGIDIFPLYLRTIFT